MVSNVFAPHILRTIQKPSHLQVQNASSSSKRPRESEAASTQESPTAKKARVECDISANFDLTGLGEESTGDSDSDFDLDYTVV